MITLAGGARKECNRAPSHLLAVVGARAIFLGVSLCAFGQDAPVPLATPPIAGPLHGAQPIDIGGGISVNGIVSGMGMWQGNAAAADEAGRADLSNGQVWVQKATGWWQFYVQAGAHNLPILGSPFLPTDDTLSTFFGPVPIAYVKVAPGKNTAVLVGQLSSLIGMESTFTFQNMNVNRGLLWNQENAVTRGVQINQTIGKLTASLSWNDGFYSNRYSCLSGSLTYAAGPHSVSFQAMGNLSQTAFRTPATPVQNNGSMYVVSYVYSKDGWTVQPYGHFGDVPTNPKAGVLKGASMAAGAVLISRSLKHGLSLAGRGEYVSSTGSAADGSVNVLYGPGSAAWSATVTPTYQNGRFFARGDLSVVRANGETPGYAFGPAGNKRTQPRATIEAGFLF